MKRLASSEEMKNVECAEVVKEPSSNGGAVDSFTARTLSILLVLNMVVMIVVAGYASGKLHEVHTTLHQAEKFIAHPERLSPLFTRMLKDASNTFLFGALNGTLANFATQLLQQNFASLAQDLFKFSSMVTSAFDNYPWPVSCYSPVTCQQPYSYVECSSGQMVYCYYQGQVINCANTTCIFPYVRSYASLTQAITKIVSTLPPLTPTGSGSAAFSDGLFNLRDLIQWVDRQTNAGQWFAAGTACKSITTSIKQLKWNGQYYDTTGQLEVFNVSATVYQVVSVIDQICNDLLNLPPSLGQYQEQHAARHHKPQPKHSRANKQKVVTK